ncbi:hypothetical protein GYMLUDRAFT_63861 [Collybiopsis luxurians FD-317 M1]|uniref:Uncharacterized protein n=1 Tax=Collybiopsis luxurians FD-317 M1 TaxID=944289 RepID=A0A0D0BEQ0_9AGAR|nr:hypothetical protein GYMLUDRAFT_63861 [Collybiopsis luxurians FD-317 M1]
MSSFLNIFPFNAPLPYPRKRDIEDADESSNSVKHSTAPKSYNCPNKKQAVAGPDRAAFDKVCVFFIPICLIHKCDYRKGMLGGALKGILMMSSNTIKFSLKQTQILKPNMLRS